ncbi:MAG TPA: hypothetical protein DER64_13840 [Planctomycetaceae bacterium]|nr:hypothetical protein [Planctomycetaceae bacterium]
MRPLSPVSRPVGRAWSAFLVGLSKLPGSGIPDGLVVALFLASMWHQVAALLGGSLATDFAVGWGLSIGACLGLSWRGRRGWLLLGLAMWSAALGGLLSGIAQGLSLVSFEQLVTVDGLPVSMLVATLALSLPMALSVRLGCLAANRGSGQLRGFLIGAAIGAVTVAHLLFGGIGVDATVLVAAMLAGLMFLVELARGGQADPGNVSPPAWTGRLDRSGLVGLAVIGVVMASLDRMLVQLVPASEWYLLVFAAALCVGGAIGHRRRSNWSVGSAAGVLLVPATFPILVEWLLYLKVAGGSPLVLLAGWSVLVLVAAMPLGVLTAVSLSPHGRSPIGSGWTSSAGVAPLAILVGLFLARWLWIPDLGPVVVLVIGAWGLAIVPGRISGPIVLSRRPLAWVLAGLVVLTTQVGRYDPGQSARLLYSARVVSAAEQKWPRRLHESLDEARMIARRETCDATLTTWSQRGALRLLRVDGIPATAWSRDAMISPRSAAGVLESLIPLVVHERPERVLLLGIGGGDGLRAGLGFPVTRIDCVEPDEGRRKLVADHIEFDDVRLSWRHVAPALAVAADSAQYDVVIATAGRSVAWRAESTRTLEFYRNAARQLSGDGVFCQAFSVGDVGIVGVDVPHASMRDVFRATVRIQVGPGRFLVVATNSPRLLNRPGVVARLQGPHVRAALAEIGWDWANLLQLPTSGPPKSGESGHSNHLGNGWLAARLPWAALAGGTHLDETAGDHPEVPQPLLNRIEVEEEMVAEVRERLADVRRGQQLMGQGAEGFRTYRRAVDKQITERPRFVFESDPSRGGIRRLRHPVDRRRLQFLKTLSSIEGLPEPSSQQIGSVVAFAVPFDPLLSEFVHREVAVLLSKSPAMDRREELQHRLHAVYFGVISNHRIDDVHEAIQSLLNVSPKGIEAATHWDHLNSLLEVLRQRWSRRPIGMSRTGGHESETIELVGEMFERMEELITLDPTLGHRWSQRQEVIERGLVKPLRDRRSRLLGTRRSGPVLAN